MIGETLRKERENQKLSVQDVERETSIRTLYIEAIEQGEYDKLPGEVYAKGFIKNYGNFLNLDGDDLVRQFILEISPTIVEIDDQKPAADNSTEVSTENTSKIAAMSSAMKKIRTKKNVEPEQTEPAEEDSESGFEPKKYLAVAAVLIAVLAGGLLMNFGGGEEPAVIDSSPKPETQAAPTPENSQAVPPEPQNAQPPAPPPISGVALQATFSDDCWTQVVVDGALVYEGMINAGQVFDWNANQNVYVVLGNAGAAQFVMNGQNIGALGGNGEVVDRVFVR